MSKPLQYLGLLFIGLVLSGCSATFSAYRDNMFNGINMLQRGRYAEARADFVKASQAQPDAYSYAFAATAAYKMNDVKGAEEYLQQAERLDGRSFAALRMAGYRALVLLGEGRRKEGLDALGTYLDLYRNVYPLRTIRDVQDMWRSGTVNLPLLELLIDEQVRTYEEEIWQYYSTGTGWYGNRYNASGLFLR